MTLRRQLRIGGTRVSWGGSTIEVPPWRSSDQDMPPNFNTSTIENGRFYGRDYIGIGTRGSIIFGAARTTTYYDTGWADVAVSLTYEGFSPYPTFPTVRVTPDVGFEHDLSTYFEPFFRYYGTACLWNVGQPAWLEGIAALMDGAARNEGVALEVRAEVIGRRLCMFVDDVLLGETVTPAHMESSTLHGISLDTQQKYWPGEDGTEAWQVNPYYPPFGAEQSYTYFGDVYDGKTALESSFSVVPITTFSHEDAGTLGDELVVDFDFSAGGSWSTDAPSEWTQNTVYSATNPVSIPGATVSRTEATDFTSGYLDAVLDAPLVSGQVYRVTQNCSTQLVNNGYYVVPHVNVAGPNGVGNITVEFYDLSPVASSGIVLTNTLAAGKTIEFTAAGNYTHIRLRGDPVLDTGSYRLLRTVNFISVRQFTATP